MVWSIIRAKSYVGKKGKSMKAMELRGGSGGWVAKHRDYTH
jgi:hypothetical protein